MDTVAYNEEFIMNKEDSSEKIPDIEDFKESLDFLDKLDIEKLKYEISTEPAGPDYRG